MLYMKNISKSFYGVSVLKNIDFKLEAGTVHALVGENGAGKSTLMKILLGIHEKDSGKIYLNGKEVKFKSPADALNNSISMIHQEICLVSTMDVAENIWLGREKKFSRYGSINLKSRYKATEELLESLDIHINPKTKVNELSVAMMQLIELCRSLSYDSKIIIMDEPTSALDPISTAKIEDLAAELKKQFTIVIVTHNMQQAVRISDRTAFFLLGEMVEFGATESLFAMPQDKRTEDYITGRFG